MATGKWNAPWRRLPPASISTSRVRDPSWQEACGCTSGWVKSKSGERGRPPPHPHPSSVIMLTRANVHVAHIVHSHRAALLFIYCNAWCF